MLRAFYHRLEGPPDERERSFLVKQVAHGIHEHEPRRPPATRKVEQVMVQPDGEPIGVAGLVHGLQAEGEPLGIAELAASADFGATSDRVPRRVRPLDRRL